MDINICCANNIYIETICSPHIMGHIEYPKKSGIKFRRKKYARDTVFNYECERIFFKMLIA